VAKLAGRWFAADQKRTEMEGRDCRPTSWAAAAPTVWLKVRHARHHRSAGLLGGSAVAKLAESLGWEWGDVQAPIVVHPQAQE
jgi:hypothetical protein